MTRIVIVSGLQAGGEREIKFGGEITVGESYSCDIVTLNPSDSQRVVSIAVSDVGVASMSVVSGLVMLNESEVGEGAIRTLSNDDVFGIGETSLRVVQQNKHLSAKEMSNVSSRLGKISSVFGVRNRIYSIVAIAVAMFGISSLQATSSTVAETAEEQFTVTDFLQNAKYENLTVVERANKHPLINGIVSTDKEIYMLDKQLVSKHIEAELRITSDERLLAIVRRFLESSEWKDGLTAVNSRHGVLTVEGLVPDNDSWMRASAEIQRDVPLISGIMSEGVLTLFDIAKLLQKNILKNDILGLKALVYGTTIKLEGTLAHEDAEFVTSEVRALETKYKNTELFDLDIRPTIKIVDHINVVSVSEIPVPYFVTDEGNVVFVGGKVSGGYVVTEINSKGIHLRMGKENYVLNLET